MKYIGQQRFLVKPPGADRLTPGVVLLVDLEQTVDYRRGPHRVGRAEVLEDKRLAVWITDASAAGRTARGLLADDVVDVWLWGTRPTVRLR